MKITTKFILLLISFCYLQCYNTEIKQDIYFDTETAVYWAKNFETAKGRQVGSKMHDSIAIQIENWLLKIADQIETQTFYCNGDSAKNIICHLNKNTVGKKVLICANYDQPNTYNPWAQTGAAAVLAIAKAIKDNKINQPIDIVLFDARYSISSDKNIHPYRRQCLGSQYWAKNLNNNNYKYGICLEKPAHKNGVITKDGHSNLYATTLLRVLSEYATKLGYNDVFSNTISNPIYGDNIIICKDAKIKTTMIETQKEINYYPNTQQFNDDNLESLDTNKLNKTCLTILQTIANY